MPCSPWFWYRYKRFIPTGTVSCCTDMRNKKTTLPWPFIVHNATGLPDDDTLLRRQIHPVAGLDAEGLVPARLVDHGAVGAELARRMRVGLDQHDLLRVARLAAPDLREAHVEAL